MTQQPQPASSSRGRTIVLLAVLFAAIAAAVVVVDRFSPRDRAYNPASAPSTAPTNNR